MDELTALENWAAPLLACLQPGERRTLARKIGTELRRSQSQRIGKQQAPDGTAYAQLKQQLRAEAGRVRQARRPLSCVRQNSIKVGANANDMHNLHVMSDNQYP